MGREGVGLIGDGGESSIQKKRKGGRKNSMKDV